MRVLELITLSTFFGGIAVAENIPLCALMFAVCFGCGYIIAKLNEQENEK